MPLFEYRKVRDSDDLRKLIQILSQCFMMPQEVGDKYAETVGLENFRIISQDGAIAGGLAILQLGQWWGGKSVAMAGIAAVGISPEYRGTGAGLALMQHTQREIYEAGVPISVLFPAVQGLYRKVGYEQAGHFCNWEISASNIQIYKQSLPLIPIDSESEILRKLYKYKAWLNNGNLERSSFIWGNITTAEDSQHVYAYLIGSVDNPQGYIIFTQKRGDKDTFMQVKDWVVLTPAAAQSFWAFLASHRSQINFIHWRGAMVEPLNLLLPEQTAKLQSSTCWMLRVVDVIKALENRGYMQNVQAELHLEVEDELLEANNGKYILSIANGGGEVNKGGKGELKLDIRGLAALYTSLHTPSQLLLAKKLIATETALITASQIFAGTSGWMADFF